MWGRKMKILPRMLLLFVSIVVFFGAVITVNAYLDSQREQKNINTLYVERGLSIAKSLDASVTGEAELQANAQPLVDELMASNLGVTEFSIHGKAPAGQSASGYWRLASNDKSIVHEASDPEDIEAIKTDKSVVISDIEDGKPIIDVTYPLHDSNGKPFATAGIKFDMTGLQSQMNTSSILLLSLIMTLLAIIATFIVAKSIIKPIVLLKDVADKISMGDLQQKVAINSDDEISELGKSFQRMINAFKMSQAMSQEGVNL
jgi:methyl-accepting chemotaxis protein